MNPLLIMGNVVVVLLLVVMVFQLSSISTQLEGLEVAAPRPSQPTADAAPTQPTPAPTPQGVDEARMQELLENAVVKGDTDAPVTIVEYSDFECPFCARFYSSTLGQIESNFVETGQVKLAYKHFPLSFHPNAQKAGEAFECANDQGKAWEMHDKLFESGVEGGVTTFQQYASDLGLDTEAFNECLSSGKYADKVSSDAQEAQSVGVRGTPGFLINGQLVSGAQPYQVFEQAINQALGN